MCVWGWRIFGHRKIFRDIDDPNVVISKFSKKEICKLEWIFIVELIVLAHFVAYGIFNAIWPEVFGR